MTEKICLYDYLTGVLLNLRDFEQKTSDIEKQARKLAENLSSFKDSKDVWVSTLPNEVESIADSLDIANLHNENAQKRVASLMEKVKKALEEETKVETP